MYNNLILKFLATRCPFFSFVELNYIDTEFTDTVGLYSKNVHALDKCHTEREAISLLIRSSQQLM